MNKNLVVGNDIFDDFIKDNGYYVDKTELIYELVEGTKKKVTLFTRPRRFGKTLAMSMMGAFFDISRDSEKMFKDMNIAKKHPNFCKEWQNQYPVLFLTFKDVEGRNFELAYAKLKTVIADVCKKNAALVENSEVDPFDVEVFQRLRGQTGTETDVQNSLNTIMRMMYVVYRKKVILLIDEYDVPLAKAQESKNQEFYQQMLDVIRGLMSISLKTNEFLQFAVITGCLRISKESIFTGVNNFACYSVTSRKFSQYFGFTAEETEQMLDAFEQSDKTGIVKEWYDGYIFGNTEVFCPWDVASYINAIMEGEGEEPQNFWANTSSNSILDDFVNDSEIDASEKFETLLNGGTITEDISEELTYDHITESEKNLWSVLLMTGYVSKADKSASWGRVKLKIPNAEVTELFKNAVMDRFERRLNDDYSETFVTAMWDKDEETASEMLTKILWDSISFFDYGEDYYHGMLNGIFSAKGFRPKSNEEEGLGRLDLRIRDRANRRTILMEFKRSKVEKNLDKDCDEAIKQIIKNGYNKTMPDGYEQQIVYGIAFFAKKAKVKLMK